MLRSKSRSGYLDFGQKKHSSFLVRSISGSKLCRGDALVDNQALVSVERNSISLSENRIVKAAMMQKQISDLEEDLKNTKARLAERDGSIERFKKQVRELEDDLEKTKQSEANMLESLMLQTRQIEQTKMDLEESKLDVIALHEKLYNLQNGSMGNHDPSSNTKALRDEIIMLRNEVKLANEGEEKSKKAMDDLASALSEVAMESSAANENLRLSEEQLGHLKKEIQRLHDELDLQRETSERIRVESEEHVLAWTAKEMGFISCIKKADEDNASLKHENHRLNEALVAAENTTRIAREEAFKLRDILKQALNESSVAKEAATIARAENSELKDLLAEKEESVHFLTKENERLRINEVAARENVKEFKRLLAAKAEANKFYEEHTEVFNSPESMLYEDHLDGKTSPRQMFNFDFDEFKAFNKEDEDMMFFHVDDNVAEIVVDDDPEKAEALKGSIFDTSASPRSEPHTPESKGQHRRAATGLDDAGGFGLFEDEEHSVHGGVGGHHHHHHHHHHHTEDGEDKGSYMSSLYNKKRLFRKIGELIIGKNNNKKEGSMEQGKEQDEEQGKEHGKETVKEHGKEHAKEHGKEKAKEHSKEKAKEHSKEKAKEQGKEKAKEQGKKQSKEHGKEQPKEQGKEQEKEQGKEEVN